MRSVTAVTWKGAAKEKSFAAAAYKAEEKATAAFVNDSPSSDNMQLAN